MNETIIPGAEIPFDESQALTLRDAIKDGLIRWVGKRQPSVQVVNRWCRHDIGLFPQGKTGPRLVLRTHRRGTRLLVMPQWIDAWKRVRVELESARERTIVLPRSKAATARSGQAAAKRLEKRGY